MIISRLLALVIATYPLSLLAQGDEGGGTPTPIVPTGITAVIPNPLGGQFESEIFPARVRSRESQDGQAAAADPEEPPAYSPFEGEGGSSVSSDDYLDGLAEVEGPGPTGVYPLPQMVTAVHDNLGGYAMRLSRGAQRIARLSARVSGQSLERPRQPVPDLEGKESFSEVYTAELKNLRKKRVVLSISKTSDAIADSIRETMQNAVRNKKPIAPNVHKSMFLVLAYLDNQNAQKPNPSKAVERAFRAISSYSGGPGFRLSQPKLTAEMDDTRLTYLNEVLDQEWSAEITRTALPENIHAADVQRYHELFRSSRSTGSASYSKNWTVLINNLLQNLEVESGPDGVERITYTYGTKSAAMSASDKGAFDIHDIDPILGDLAAAMHATGDLSIPTKKLLLALDFGPQTTTKQRVAKDLITLALDPYNESEGAYKKIAGRSIDTHGNSPPSDSILNVVRPRPGTFSSWHTFYLQEAINLGGITFDQLMGHIGAIDPDHWRGIRSINKLIPEAVEFRETLKRACQNVIPGSGTNVMEVGSRSMLTQDIQSAQFDVLNKVRDGHRGYPVVNYNRFSEADLSYPDKIRAALIFNKIDESKIDLVQMTALIASADNPTKTYEQVSALYPGDQPAPIREALDSMNETAQSKWKFRNYLSAIPKSDRPAATKLHNQLREAALEQPAERRGGLPTSDPAAPEREAPEFPDVNSPVASLSPQDYELLMNEPLPEDHQAAFFLVSDSLAVMYVERNLDMRHEAADPHDFLMEILTPRAVLRIDEESPTILEGRAAQTAMRDVSDMNRRILSRQYLAESAIADLSVPWGGRIERFLAPFFENQTPEGLGWGEPPGYEPGDGRGDPVDPDHDDGDPFGDGETGEGGGI